jgi:hypothetical protein
MRRKLEIETTVMEEGLVVVRYLKQNSKITKFRIYSRGQ